MGSDVNDALREPDEGEIGRDSTETKQEDQEDPPLVTAQYEAYEVDHLLRRIRSKRCPKTVPQMMREA